MSKQSASGLNIVTQNSHVTIVETIRDAFQGLHLFIPTPEKIAYISSLVDAGARNLDIGSFVSPKAVPQLVDTDAVLSAFRGHSQLTLCALIANEKGLDRVLECGGLKVISFPLSVSSEFQERNTNRSLHDAWALVKTLHQRIGAAGIVFEVYLSMAFGNPYGEFWQPVTTLEAVDRLSSMGIKRVGLADTIGVATPDHVALIFKEVLSMCPELSLGAHMHGRPETWAGNVQAALDAGCRRFDSATGALGGCPFAQDQLVSNVPTEGLVALLESRGHATGFDLAKLNACAQTAAGIRAKYSA